MELFIAGISLGIIAGIIFVMCINRRDRRKDTIGTLHAVRLPDDTHTNLLLEPNDEIDVVLANRDYAFVKISRK